MFTRHSRASLCAIVAFLVVSFWSSGVVLIRACDAYRLWDGGIGTIVVFIAAIPLVFGSVAGTKRLLRALHDSPEMILWYTVIGVVLVHAAVLTLSPQLYGFASSPGLVSVSWLLWFSGFCMIACGPHTNTRS